MIDFNHKVKLDAINTDDLHKIRLWRNKPEVYEWCRQNDLISDYKQKKWYVSQANNDAVRMFMVKDGTNYPVGVCGLTSIDWVNSRAEFSLYIDPKARGKGLARAGLKTLFDYGFKTLGLNLIWGETFEGNPAHKLFESLKMKKDGVRRQFYFKDGRYINATLYSVTSKEWVDNEHFSIPDRPYDPCPRGSYFLEAETVIDAAERGRD
jgi:RimJ/RimL family protein N-acetyltransferase